MNKPVTPKQMQTLDASTLSVSAAVHMSRHHQQICPVDLCTVPVPK